LAKDRFWLVPRRQPGELRVQRVPEADAHQVQALGAQHLLRVRVGPGDPEPLLQVAPAALDRVRRRNQLDLRNPPVPPRVRPSNAAASDDPRPVSHPLPPPWSLSLNAPPPPGADRPGSASPAGPSRSRP